MMILHQYALCEGILTKEQIITSSNKEIFYRMKNNGYIKETSKKSNVYKATKKLEREIKRVSDLELEHGASTMHSRKIFEKIMKNIPNSVIQEGRFSTGKTLKKEFEAYKKTNEYHIAIERIKSNIYRKEATINYKSKNASGGKERFSIRQEKAKIEMEKSVLQSQTPAYAPDLEICLSSYELEQMTQSIENEYEISQGREREFLQRDLEVLHRELSKGLQEYSLQIEIVTDSYGNRRLEQHHNYELIFDKEIIYL